MSCGRDKRGELGDTHGLEREAVQIAGMFYAHELERSHNKVITLCGTSIGRFKRMLVMLQLQSPRQRRLAQYHTRRRVERASVPATTASRIPNEGRARRMGAFRVVFRGWTVGVEAGLVLSPGRSTSQLAPPRGATWTSRCGSADDSAWVYSVRCSLAERPQSHDIFSPSAVARRILAETPPA